jgi:Zn-finger nucleic acid-binding protein
MNCPQCHQALAHEPGCHSCPTCGGVWFEQQEALLYFGFKDVSVSAEVVTENIIERSSDRRCPACNLWMDSIELDHVLVLDRCLQCKGLFFDAGESLALRSKLVAGHGGPSFRRKVFTAVSYRTGPYR